MKKRTLAVLLCLVLVGSFAACDMEFGGLVGELLGTGDINVGEQPINPGIDVQPYESWWDEDTYVEMETEGPQEELPAGMYAGQTLSVLGDNAYDLGLTESQENVVESLSYQRNLAVEENYGISIVLTETSSYAIVDEVRKDILAGATDFDVVIAGMSLSGATLTVNGSLANLYSLPYLNLNGSSWDESIHEGLAIGSYLPMATGQIAPSSDLCTSALVFNTQMADEMGIDMYDYVQTGGWTLEKMHAIVNEFYLDLNGNGKSDVDDRFGLVIDDMHVYAFACAADAMMICKDDQNMPMFGDYRLERMSMAYDEFYQMMQQNATWHDKSDLALGNQYESALPVFEQGNAFFYATSCEEMLYDLTDMEEQYGILPYPKLDMDQEHHLSFVSTTANAVMVPKSSRDPELVGYALEAMAQLSDGLYREQLKMRVCRSERDVEMLELVLDSKTLDFGSAYLLGEVGSPIQYFKIALDQNELPMMTLVKQYEKMINEYLQNLSSVSASS